MYRKYSHMNKLMLTFTYSDENKYHKMYIINEIKNYFTRLVHNTKSDNIKFYSNIELGSELDNPHLHIQVFYKDYNQLITIRNKVIAKFGLFSEYCEVSIPEKEDVIYDYVIKEYKQEDSKLLKTDIAKRDYRSMLDKKLRFTSMSKEKYTKSTYKKAYSKGIKKQFVDELLDDCVINKEIEIIDNRVILFSVMLILMYILRTRKIEEFELCFDNKSQIQLQKIFCYWIFGFI